MQEIKAIPENTNDPGLKNAYDAAEQYNWTRPELDAYDSVSMREQDDRGKITNAYKEGLEAGAKERRQREKEIAKIIREEEKAKEFKRKKG